MILIFTDIIGSTADDGDWCKLSICGTCEVLEKPYLRLTTVRQKINLLMAVKVPDPSQVRPERVLMKALDMVKQRWKEKQDWEWVCEQLKSIRQDLTVCHLFCWLI